MNKNKIKQINKNEKWKSTLEINSFQGFQGQTMHSLYKTLVHFYPFCGGYILCYLKCLKLLILLLYIILLTIPRTPSNRITIGDVSMHDAYMGCERWGRV